MRRMMATTTADDASTSPMSAMLLRLSSLPATSATMEIMIVIFPKMSVNQLSQPRHGMSPSNVTDARMMPIVIATRGSDVPVVVVVCAGAGGYGAGYGG